jgi:hypothetical protein
VDAQGRRLQVATVSGGVLLDCNARRSLQELASQAKYASRAAQKALT